jgi:hypothetical protein
MDKRLENRELMESFKKKLLKESDSDYYIGIMDDIVEHLETLLFEIAHEDGFEDDRKVKQLFEKAISCVESASKYVKRKM